MTMHDDTFQPVAAPVRGENRKAHKSVPQWMLLAFLQEVGPQPLPEIALVADISEHQARRKLDGLVQRGRSACAQAAHTAGHASTKRPPSGSRPPTYRTAYATRSASQSAGSASCDAGAMVAR